MTILDKLTEGVILAVAWMGSIEWRLRGKVNKDTCTALHGSLDTRLGRIESHQYDLMKAMKVTPSIDPPEEIKNRGNH